MSRISNPSAEAESLKLCAIDFSRDDSAVQHLRGEIQNAYIRVTGLARRRRPHAWMEPRSCTTTWEVSRGVARP